MIDRDHDLSIVRQAKALGVARSSVYYAPRPVSTEDLQLMRRLDELHLDHPIAGARMLRNLLRREGVAVGRRHVATLMKRIGIEAIYRRPNTSKPAPGHKIYPYLLRGVTIERPNQVWATDISNIPIRRGFVYRQQRVFLSALRFLANDLRAALVCAGTDLARQALLTAAQLAERFEAFHLERWKNDGALAVSRSSPRGRRGRRGAARRSRGRAAGAGAVDRRQRGRCPSDAQHVIGAPFRSGACRSDCASRPSSRPTPFPIWAPSLSTALRAPPRS
jgi:hypothetical protein